MVAFVGVLIGFTGGNVANIFAAANFPIVAFAVGLALLYALGNVIIKWQMLDNDIFLCISSFALTAFFGVLFVFSGAHFVQFGLAEIVVILWVAVTNVFSFYMYMYAFKTLKTTMVTNSFLLSPFLTFVWANLLFNEPIKVYYLAIAALVGVGILIQRTDTEGGSYIMKNSNGFANFTIFDVTGAFANQDGEIGGIIMSGGRVLATKLPMENAHYVDSISFDPRFANVYTGDEAFIGEQAEFVRDVLGANSDDVVVMKAGTDADNERFFDELGSMVSEERAAAVSEARRSTGMDGI